MSLSPRIQRRSMTPKTWTPFWAAFRLLIKQSFVQSNTTPSPSHFRRRVLLVLVITTMTVSGWLFSRTLTPGNHPFLTHLQITLSVFLTGWVSAGFFTALMGFWVSLNASKLNYPALSGEQLAHLTLHSEAKTAIIMPICNEDVHTVFANLRAIGESLLQTEARTVSALFILSDSSKPEILESERLAATHLRAAFQNKLEIYYRHRTVRSRKKAGNVADFCRRWGQLYRYMVVLDADSLMTGSAITELIKTMEARPNIGILQTAPQPCGMNTWHGRILQVASQLPGQLFTRGMAYWQQGESHYWGHNAILRIAPFMNHCALSRLPGQGGLSGEILSHDFVEAALMRRAGFEIWLLPHIEGSYEQPPANLLEELQRDRRWCQGNLKNLRLIAEPGLTPTHRMMLLTGGLAYLSAPLWLTLLVVGMLLQALNPHHILHFFTLSNAYYSLPLWGITLAILFLPRGLAVANVLIQRQQSHFGGKRHLFFSAAGEAFFAAIQAPIKMVAHSYFVLVALTGLEISWKSPARTVQSLTWNDWSQRLTPFITPIFALCFMTLWLAPLSALWVAPLLIPAIIIIPFGVWTSRLQPEETWNGVFSSQNDHQIPDIVIHSNTHHSLLNLLTTTQTIGTN